MAIVARWEWRVFGKGNFGEAEKMIRDLPMDSNKKTDEEYILSRKSDENVKIRFDLIDVKSLQNVNEDNLAFRSPRTNWRSCLKSSRWICPSWSAPSTHTISSSTSW